MTGYIDTPSKDTGVPSNSVAGKEGNHSGQFGDLKKQLELNGCDRRTLRMDQQHCSYSAILT